MATVTSFLNSINPFSVRNHAEQRWDHLQPLHNAARYGDIDHLFGKYSARRWDYISSNIPCHWNISGTVLQHWRINGFQTLGILQFFSWVLLPFRTHRPPAFVFHRLYVQVDNVSLRMNVFNVRKLGYPLYLSHRFASGLPNQFII